MKNNNFANWFAMYAKDYFSLYLKEHFNKPNLKYLQLGAYTGDSTIWIMENILTDKTSLLIDVDSWEGAEKDEFLSLEEWAQVELIYDERIKKYNNVFKKKMKTENFFIDNSIKDFDFIYLDAEKVSSKVYSDAVSSFKILKNNGVMAFDDYDWNPFNLSQIFTPKLAIDKFLFDYKNNIEAVFKSNKMVWIIKK